LMKSSFNLSIVFIYNLGIGGAMQAGYIYAHAKGIISISGERVSG
jgi:hypothetical protein